MEAQQEANVASICGEHMSCFYVAIVEPYTKNNTMCSPPHHGVMPFTIPISLLQGSHTDSSLQQI